MVRRDDDAAGIRCWRALAWCFACASAWLPLAGAASLGEKARESGCVGKPAAISGDLYKCTTASGSEAFFNVPNNTGGASVAPRRSDVKAVPNTNNITPSAPTGFPRVDPETQKGRDDLRRKVLSDELSAEEKALADARIAYDGGAPAPLAEEKADAEKYRQRIARLREAVALHQRNVEALKKELGTTR